MGAFLFQKVIIVASETIIRYTKSSKREGSA